MPCCAFTISVCAFAFLLLCACRFLGLASSHIGDGHNMHAFPNTLHTCRAVHSLFLSVHLQGPGAGKLIQTTIPTTNSPTRCMLPMPCTHVSFVLSCVWCALQGPGAGKLTQTTTPTTHPQPAACVLCPAFTFPLCSLFGVLCRIPGLASSHR